MKVLKKTLHLVIIYFFLFVAFFISSEFISIGLPISDVFILLTAIFTISLITLLFFSWGRKKDEKRSALFTLAAISLKMLLNMVLILIYYMLSKIDGIKFIVSFFTIYLFFTVYLMWSFINSLNIKKVKN